MNVAITNDSLQDLDGIVTYALMDFSGKSIDSGSINVSVAKQSVAEVCSKNVCVNVKSRR
ncbi:MAG: hypothetical protein MZU97_19980 [Bacillus subtilis]|nr:hypothetical protein [Bacillus subtilis]